MKIDIFIGQIIEGYLFNDIDNMLKIKLEGGNKYGACGYPILMSTLSAMELLGDLLSKSPIQSYQKDPRQGNKNFIGYWEDYFCEQNPKYKVNKGDELFRILIRHGLAHRFLTLPGIFITIDKPKLHWTINIEERQIWIDAKQFYMDFRNSYELLVKRGITDKGEMQKRLNEINRLYMTESSRLFEKIISNGGAKSMGKQTLSAHSNEASSTGSPAAFTCLPTSGMPASGTSYSGNFPIFKKEYFDEPDDNKDKK